MKTTYPSSIPYPQSSSEWALAGHYTDTKIVDYFEQIAEGVDPKFLLMLVEQVTFDLADEVLRNYHRRIDISYVMRQLVSSNVFSRMSVEYHNNILRDPGLMLRHALAPLERAMEDTREKKRVYTGFVYVFERISTIGKAIYKIGISKDPDERLKTINRAIPPGSMPLSVRFAYCVESPEKVEASLHNRFSHVSVRAETGGMEWFNLTEEDLDEIEDELYTLEIKMYERLADLKERGELE